MEKHHTLLFCALILISSCFLCSESRLMRKLNANPQDALGFYDNPYIPPDLKRFLSPVIPYIPNPPFDPMFPPDPENDPPPTTFPWSGLPNPSFPNPTTPQNPKPNPNPNPTPANPTPVPPTTPQNPNPTPANPTPIPPTTPNPPPSSSGGGNGGNVPIVNQGTGGGGSSNGNSDSWWYKIDANGNVYTSPNFFNDPNVPDFVKQLVENISWNLKNGGHP